VLAGGKGLKVKGVKVLWRILAIPLGVLVLDQASKLWVVEALPYGGQKPVIPGFFHLVHTRNRGIAFGLFADGGPGAQALLLTLIGLLLAFVVWQLCQHHGALGPRLGLGLILGGALGNLADRLLRGEVVDFLDFFVVLAGKAYHWPAFNLADAAITLGAIGLLLWESRKGAHASHSH
jgi:signal peptidase II